ncbi:MAG: hypothetical protein Rubg2KO_10790 [Rubricoccaceae bacterium]
MRLLALLLWLAATPLGLAQEVALGVWTRLDSTVVPAGEFTPEIRVDVRQVEVTNSTVVFTSILRATSGEESGNLIAQRQTVSRQLDAADGAIELAMADVEVRGDTLVLTDHAIPVRSGAYVRSTGRIPEGAVGVWKLPAEIRGPDRIEITPEGHVLDGADTLFTAIAVLGDYVVTTDQDFADKEAYERGEMDFQTFEVFGLLQLDTDRLSIHLPPEPPLELARALSPTNRSLGTWVNADSTFIAATDSTAGYHVLYTRVTLTDSTQHTLTVGYADGDASEPDAYETPYAVRWDGDVLTATLMGMDAQTQRVEVRRDTLWFSSVDGTRRSEPFVRQLEAPPFPETLVSVWTDGVVVDNAGVPAFVTIEIRDDGTLVASGQKLPMPLKAYGRFLLVAQPEPDELYPGELPIRWFDVIPYTLAGDRLTLGLADQPVTFHRSR